MVSAIMVAAGKGTRMGPGVDKLFLEVAGKPVVLHTWQRLDSSSAIDEIIVVVREGMRGAFEDLAVAVQFKKPFRLTMGGRERQESVWNGLQAVSPATEVVVIQDAARPCTTGALISATIQSARETGAAVAAQRVTDTIKESDGGTLVQRTIDRARLWSVQTPQTFRLEVIQRAMNAIRQQGAVVTDDTAACELIGQPVRLVESATPNPKVTSPSDLPFIELLLKTGLI
jgi:2-C-methyl-D-erythritol 4-phosphate cytidylyltransferase